MSQRRRRSARQRQENRLRLPPGFLRTLRRRPRGSTLTGGLQLSSVTACTRIGWGVLAVDHPHDRVRDAIRGHDGLDADVRDRVRRHPRIQGLVRIPTFRTRFTPLLAFAGMLILTGGALALAGVASAAGSLVAAGAGLIGVGVVA